MLVLLSPAKNLDFGQLPDTEVTTPRLSADTDALARKAARLTKPQLKQLMSISDDLAKLNQERFRNFGGPDTSEAPAMFAFAGDVYRGLDARSMDAPARAHAQTHLRILSGLYGLLRPLDAIRPYRLEMGTRLATRRGEDLYDFWGTRIADLLNADLQAAGGGPILNLASNEYARAVDRKTLTAPLVEVQFFEEKDGKSRQLFVFLKKARGLLARWICDNQITTVDDLSGFDVEGYRFDAAASESGKLVFRRRQPAKTAA